MTLQDLLTPTYLQMLPTLSDWLGSAARQQPGGAADALLSARLAPDMFPLSTQVRFACVQALEGMARLRDEEPPPLAALLKDEGRRAGEHPGSIAAAQARIAETLGLVTTASDDMPYIDPAAPIAHALPQGMIFDFSATQYVRDWALPQFYFHVMTAYAILRASDVTLGKADYVAHLFSYVRPGTMPG